jgi:hypothetical protein
MQASAPAGNDASTGQSHVIENNPTAHTSE